MNFFRLYPQRNVHVKCDCNEVKEDFQIQAMRSRFHSSQDYFQRRIVWICVRFSSHTEQIHTFILDIEFTILKSCGINLYLLVNNNKMEIKKEIKILVPF